MSITIGIHTAHDTSDFQELVQELNQRLDFEVTINSLESYDAVLSSLRSGESGIANLGASGYSGIYIEDAELVSPIFKRLNSDGSTGYHSIMITRADSDISSLDDLSGKVLGFGSIESTSGYLAPAVELTEEGYSLSAGDYFSGVLMTGGHFEAIEAVRDGVVDAAVTWSTRVGEFSDGYNSGAFREFLDVYDESASSFREIWYSSKIPSGGYFAHRSVDQSDLDSFFVVLSDVFNSGEYEDGFKEMFSGSQLSGLEQTSHDDYQTIVDTRREFFFGTDQDDLITSSPGSDLIRGLAGADTLTAGAGDDVVDGGSDDDLLIGGSGLGNDTYIGGTGVDTVKYTSATAGIRVNLENSTAASISDDAASIGQDQLSGIENIIGGQYDDILIGDGLANRLEGGAGSDQLNGGAGVDTAVFSLARLAISQSNNQFQVGNDTLTNIERLEFTDKKVAVDFERGENSFKAAALITTMFGSDLIPTYFAPAVDLIDQGSSIDQIAQLAIDLGLVDASSNENFFANVYENVVGVEADPSTQALYVSQLDSGELSQAELVVIGANASIIEAQMSELATWRESGLDYLEF